MCGNLLLSLLLAASWSSLCRGQLGLSDDDMQNAVDKLSSIFYNIRNEGLGIDSLEEVFRAAQYTASPTVEDEEIRELLRDDIFSTSYNTILELFDNVSSIAMSPSVSTTPVVSCCDSGASSATVCGYTPPAVSVNSDIATVLADFTPVTNGRVMFGGVDGSITRVPPSQTPPQDCIVEDSRLQPWFVNEVRDGSRPMEIVFLMDLVTDDEFITTTAEDQMRTLQAAELILDSLPNIDFIGAVGLELINRISQINARLTSPRVVSVCLDTILELKVFLRSFTATSTTRLRDLSYGDGFTRALSLFSNSPNTDKHLLYFTLGDSVELNIQITEVINGISSGPSGVIISVYRALDDIFNVLRDDVATNGADGVIVLDPPTMLPNLVGSYYSIPSNIAFSDNVRLGRDNGEEGNVLTLARPIFNNETEFLGVVYATLPFQFLLSRLFEFIRARPYSYGFVVDQDQKPFYHPLLPGEIVEDISLLNLEPEGVITEYLNSHLMDSVPVNKEHLIYGGASDRFTYISHMVPSTYWCDSQTIGGGRSFSICLVLADDERTFYTLNHGDIDIEAIYRSQEPPVYHNVLMRVDQSPPLCNYYCKLSIKNRLSFQLTTPSRPMSMDTPALVTELTDYIKGTGPLPANVRMGVAEEAALSVAVSTAWLNTSSTSSDYITRRHLATPSGLYLTFPPAHLFSNFNPTASEWYLYSSARRFPITITPPHVDPLVEGRSLTVSVGYTIRNPISQDDQSRTKGMPSAVVSGEVTLDALRVFVRESLPLCEGFRGSDVECLIVDETGNLIYERVNNNEKGGGRFFGSSVNRLRTIVSELGSLITKRQCASLFNSLEKTRRFHNLNTTMDGVVKGGLSGRCSEFMAQVIPGTNAFLIISETANCDDVICSCSSTCLNCDSFNNFCECPCHCLEDCQPLSTSIPACPSTPSVDTYYIRVDPEEDDLLTKTDPLCFNQTCNCRSDFDSCFGVRDCHWCETEGKCIQNTGCCDSENPNCCRTEFKRFLPFRETCFTVTEQCFDNPEGFLNVTCPLRVTSVSSKTSTIVAAVIGVIIGVVLITLIIALFVYYQFFRKADPAEETSRESAFDFSNKTAIVVDGGVSSGKRKGSKTQSVSDNESDKGKVTVVTEEQQKELTPPKEKDETTL